MVVRRGEMLLDIEKRIGELAMKEEKSGTLPQHKVPEKGTKHKLAGSKSTGAPPKHERLGIPAARVHQARAIAKHPEVVERVKASSTSVSSG
jgi:hypothetical protein